MSFKFLFGSEFLKHYYNKSNYRYTDYAWKGKEVILLVFVNKRFIYKWTLHPEKQKNN